MTEFGCIGYMESPEQQSCLLWNEVTLLQGCVSDLLSRLWHQCLQLYSRCFLLFFLQLLKVLCHLQQLFVVKPCRIKHTMLVPLDSPSGGSAFLSGLSDILPEIHFDELIQGIAIDSDRSTMGMGGFCLIAGVALFCLAAYSIDACMTVCQSSTLLCCVL